MKTGNGFLPFAFVWTQERSFKTENPFPGNQQASPARKASKLTADLHLSLHFPKPVPQSQPQLCSRTPAAVSLPILHPSRATQTGPSKFPSSSSLICPIPQLQQALPGNPQATLTMEARWLTTDLHFPLHSSKSNAPGSSPVL